MQSAAIALSSEPGRGGSGFGIALLGASKLADGRARLCLTFRLMPGSFCFPQCSF